MNITVYDRSSLPVSKRVMTDEGFMRVPGHVARVGIQEYTAGELGLKGDQNRIVKVYRPADEVFDSESLASYEGKDITIDHPQGFIDAQSYKKLTAGVVLGEGSPDGDFVLSDLLIKDSTAIAKIDAGKVQLSVGYAATYDDKVPEGADYEFIQRDIRVNHVALVDRARAGAQARLFDNKGKPMKKITLDGGRVVEVEDDAKASLIEDAFQRLEAKLADASTKADEAKEEAEKAKAEKDEMEEQMEEEKKKSSDAAIHERIKAVADTVDRARKITGDAKFSCDSVDPIAVMRDAMAIKRPKINWGDKADVYVQAAFDMAEDAAPEDKAAKTHDGLAADLASGATADADSPRAKYNADTANAWKKGR